MEYKEALKILRLDKKHTEGMLKKAYYKKALECHPDKGGDPEEFKKIGEAYETIQQFDGLRKDCIDDYDDDYSSLLKKAVHWFDPKGSWDEQFINTSFKNILLHCENASIEIFKKLSVEKSIKFLDIITKYELIFQLKKETVNKMHNILKEKLHDNIIVLDVLLEDILDDKIYKYELGDNIHYIPLWHKYFYLDDVKHSESGSKITTLRTCSKIGKYFFNIKDNNDIYFKIDINLQELFNKGYYEFEIGKLYHKIYAVELKIKKEQIYLIKNKGISKVNKKNTYDTSKRGDVYIEITLV
tara:strand:- start:580 stop:1476 length:897 start_codon:yes stop_codon:yes gene_type:complete